MRLPVFLTGFMACGKSTLGRAVARRESLRFVDLDDAVCAAAGLPTVSAVFAECGEATFRRLEGEVLRRVAGEADIVACGGGTFCRPDNAAFMLAAGTVVWLQADTDVTVARLRLQRGLRPLVDALLDNPEALRIRVEEMQAARREAYARAPHTFDSSRLESLEQIEASAEAFTNEFLRP